MADAQGRVGFLVIKLLLLLLPVLLNAEKRTIVNVGVIYENNWYGKGVHAAFEIAQQIINNQTLLGEDAFLQLHFFNSRGDLLLAANTALRFLNATEVVAVIGPQTSEETVFVADLCNSSNVPIISYSATNKFLSERRNPFFFQLPHSDAVQADAVAALVSYYGWRNVVIIHSDDAYGKDMLPFLSQSLGSVGSEIAYRSAIPVSAETLFLRQELYKLMTMQTRVFIVHMSADLGSVLFAHANSIGMLDSGYAWIVSEGIGAQLEALHKSTMHGVLAFRTFLENNTNQEYFHNIWNETFWRENTSNQPALNVYAYYAYDAVWMLAYALKRLPDKNFEFSIPEGSDLKVFQQGDYLRKLLSETNFQGVTGQVTVQDGEVADPAYEILNVRRNNSYHRIGFWGNKSGLWNDSRKNGLNDDVPWPGSTWLIPRGWVTPTNAKKARIAVPVKVGFREFVNSEKRGREFVITGGFTIDVFQSVLARLPYAYPFEFVPVGDGIVNPNYSEIIEMVFNGIVDGAVGDITTTSERSEKVKFTQPYWESDLVMLVKEHTGYYKRPWAFTYPFNWEVWCAIGGSLVFTALVVWIVERNEAEGHFQGSATEQLTASIWFSLNTFFFAERERIVSGPARVVIIIWLFVVLILTSTYTASLTSILTVEKSKPSMDFETLKERRLPVGYQNGSFVHDLLLDQFDHFGIDANVTPYASEKDYADALNEKRVEAIVDELPFIKVFLSKYCGYTTVTIKRTGGLAFVFPKGSPVLSDMSTAILELSESGEMERIENKWFNSTPCAWGKQVVSNQLQWQSFMEIYAITAGASLLAFIIFFAYLFHTFQRSELWQKKGSEERCRSASILHKMKLFLRYVAQEERPPVDNEVNDNVAVSAATDVNAAAIEEPFSRSSGRKLKKAHSHFHWRGDVGAYSSMAESHVLKKSLSHTSIAYKRLKTNNGVD